MWILQGIVTLIVVFLSIQAVEGFKKDIVDRVRKDEEDQRIRDDLIKDINEYNRLYPDDPNKIDPKVFKKR